MNIIATKIINKRLIFKIKSGNVWSIVNRNEDFIEIGLSLKKKNNRKNIKPLII